MNALALPIRGVELLKDIERMLGKGMSPVAIRRALEARGMRRRRAEKCIAIVQRTQTRQEFYEGPDGRMRRYRHIGEQTIEDVLDGKITHEQANAVASLLRVLVKAEAAPASNDNDKALPAPEAPRLVATTQALAAELAARGANEED